MKWSRVARFSRRQPSTIAVACFLVVAAVAFLTAASTPPPSRMTSEELGRLLFWDPILSGPMDGFAGWTT